MKFIDIDWKKLARYHKKEIDELATVSKQIDELATVSKQIDELATVSKQIDELQKEKDHLESLLYDKLSNACNKVHSKTIQQAIGSLKSNN